MQIKELSEEQLVEKLKHKFPSFGNIIGIGDDCAVIPLGNGNAWLITTDILLERIHFLRHQIHPGEVGFKTVAVSVSDISAKGGLPKYAFLSIALPKDLDCSWVEQMIQGVEDACAEWNISLLGGDTVASKSDIFLNITLVGTAIEEHIKYRNGAKPNDCIFITGEVGNSGGGFKMLQNGVSATSHTQKLIDAHFHPQPDPQQGVWLSARPEVHAMMDISDGLCCDLKRLLAASKCGGILEVSKLPLSRSLIDVCKENGWDPIEVGLTGGEDYCLLLTIGPEGAMQVQKEFQDKFGVPLYEIGRLIEHPSGLHFEKHGDPLNFQYVDFNHFS